MFEAILHKYFFISHSSAIIPSSPHHAMPGSCSPPHRLFVSSENGLRWEVGAERFGGCCSTVVWGGVGGKNKYTSQRAEVVCRYCVYTHIKPPKKTAFRLERRAEKFSILFGMEKGWRGKTVLPTSSWAWVGRRTSRKMLLFFSGWIHIVIQCCGWRAIAIYSILVFFWLPTVQNQNILQTALCTPRCVARKQHETKLFQMVVERLKRVDSTLGALGCMITLMLELFVISSMTSVCLRLFRKPSTYSHPRDWSNKQEI